LLQENANEVISQIAAANQLQIDGVKYGEKRICVLRKRRLSRPKLIFAENETKALWRSSRIWGRMLVQRVPPSALGGDTAGARFGDSKPAGPLFSTLYPHKDEAKGVSTQDGEGYP
jgi:hypothetical protein